MSGIASSAADRSVYALSPASAATAQRTIQRKRMTCSMMAVIIPMTLTDLRIYELTHFTDDKQFVNP